jgi:glutaredoxin
VVNPKPDISRAKKTGHFNLLTTEVSMSKIHVIIYSRPGCHLCDEAKAAIMSAGCSDRFTLEEVNIESDDELLRKYKYDIPVIAIDGVETFMHRVDPKDFIRVIRG